MFFKITNAKFGDTSKVREFESRSAAIDAANPLVRRLATELREDFDRLYSEFEGALREVTPKADTFVFPTPERAEAFKKAQGCFLFESVSPDVVCCRGYFSDTKLAASAGEYGGTKLVTP